MERSSMIDHLQQISRANLANIQRFAGQFHNTSLKRGTRLGADRESLQSLCYLKKGLLHHYVTASKTSQHFPKNTVTIYQSNDFFINSFNHSQPTEDIEALQDSELFVLNVEKLNEVIGQHPELLFIYQDLIHHHHRQTLVHLRLLQNGTALQKYQAIAEHFGQRLYLIPNQYRASYIGISRKHLYRINLALIKGGHH